MPFDSQSFDCVLSTLALCSIPDVATALAEVGRVLKPGGEFLFLEHGRHPSARVSRWQDRLDGMWGRIFDGCHINRDIGAIVRHAGFEVIEVVHPALPRVPSIAGFCFLGRARYATGVMTSP